MKLVLTIGFIFLGIRIYSQTTYIQASNINITFLGKSIILDSTINLKTKNGKVTIILVKNDSILVTKTIKVYTNKRGTGVKYLGHKTYYHKKEIRIQQEKLRYKHFDGNFFTFLISKIIKNIGIHPGYDEWSAKGSGWFGGKESNCEYIPIEKAHKAICYEFTIKIGTSKPTTD